MKKGEKNDDEEKEEEKHHLMEDTINHVKHSNTFNEILAIYHVARFIRIYLFFLPASNTHIHTHHTRAPRTRTHWNKVRKWKNLWEINTHYLLLIFLLLPRLFFWKENTRKIISLFLSLSPFLSWLLPGKKYNKIPQKCHGLWLPSRTITTTKIQQQKCAMQIRKKNTESSEIHLHTNLEKYFIANCKWVWRC